MEVGSIPTGPTNALVDKLVKSLLSKGRVLSVRVRARVPKVNLEDDAGGMVRRLALKTRFSEMGWGSTPPSSASVTKKQQFQK